MSAISVTLLRLDNLFDFLSDLVICLKISKNFGKKYSSLSINHIQGNIDGPNQFKNHLNI